MTRGRGLLRSATPTAASDALSAFPGGMPGFNLHRVLPSRTHLEVDDRCCEAREGSEQEAEGDHAFSQVGAARAGQEASASVSRRAISTPAKSGHA